MRKSKANERFRAPGPVARIAKVLLAWAMLAAAAVAACAAPPRDAELSLRRLFPADQVRSESSMNFDVEHLAKDAGWVKDVLSYADAARREVNRATDDALLVRIRIVLAPDRKSFTTLVGDWAENSLAVADSTRRAMVFNRDALLRSPPHTLADTLVHEFAHIYVGLRFARRPPRWLNEGIAMNITGEWEGHDAAALVIARLGGRLIPLRDIQDVFPVEANRQRLAYRQSYSMVRFLVNDAAQGSLGEFLRKFSGPAGAAYCARFFDPGHRDSLEQRWKKSLVSGAAMAQVALSWELGWGLIVVLSVAAWYVVRRRRRRLHEEWEDEEKVYAVLDEEEKRICGDGVDEGVPDDDEQYEKPGWRRKPGRDYAAGEYVDRSEGGEEDEGDDNSGNGGRWWYRRR